LRRVATADKAAARACACAVQIGNGCGIRRNGDPLAHHLVQVAEEQAEAGDIGVGEARAPAMARLRSLAVQGPPLTRLRARDTLASRQQYPVVGHFP
jgi:hypothetical protein